MSPRTSRAGGSSCRRCASCTTTTPKTRSEPGVSRRPRRRRALAPAGREARAAAAALRAQRRLRRHDRSRAYHAGPEEGEPSHQQGERLELPPLRFVRGDDQTIIGGGARVAALAPANTSPTPAGRGAPCRRAGHNDISTRSRPVGPRTRSQHFCCAAGARPYLTGTFSSAGTKFQGSRRRCRRNAPQRRPAAAALLPRNLKRGYGRWTLARVRRC